MALMMTCLRGHQRYASVHRSDALQKHAEVATHIQFSIYLLLSLAARPATYHIATSKRRLVKHLSLSTRQTVPNEIRLTVDDIHAAHTARRSLDQPTKWVNSPGTCDRPYASRGPMAHISVRLDLVSHRRRVCCGPRPRGRGAFMLAAWRVTRRGYRVVLDGEI